MELRSRKLIGSDIEEVLQELAQLRIQIFFEYPYLYDGHLEYEMNYLQRYLKSSNSFFFGLWDQEKLVGATTGIPLIDEDSAFKKPFIDHQIELDKIYYFGESLLKPEYRGQKIGHLFFDERESYAVKTHQYLTTCFCSVLRPSGHPLKPHSYRPHDHFWIQRGYKKQSELLAQYSWQDRNENHESTKSLEFWTQDWNL